MRHERGVAMVWALFLVIATSGLTAVLIERDVVLRRDATVDAQRLAARSAAEGALAQVRHALARGAPPADGEQEIGRFTVARTVLPLDADRWQVTLVAQPGNARIEATLRTRDGLAQIERWRGGR